MDIHEAVTSCTSDFEISQQLIRAGATESELRQLLLYAAAGIAATKVPEENYRIIKYLLDRGVRPDFTDPEEFEGWSLCIKQTYPKKILRFLLSSIELPDAVADLARKRLKERKGV